MCPFPFRSLSLSLSLHDTLLQQEREGEGREGRQLRAVFASPFLRRSLVPFPIRLVDVGNLRDQGIIGIWIGEHGADGEKDLGDSQGGGPLVTENIQTDGTIGIDIGMVDPSDKVDLWGFKGIIGGKVDREEEDASRVRRITGAHDGCLPVEQVIP